MIIVRCCSFTGNGHELACAQALISGWYDKMVQISIVYDVEGSLIGFETTQDRLHNREGMPKFCG